MPVLIRNIDDYFAEKQRDLYMIVFGQRHAWQEPGVEVPDNPDGRDELMAWFATQMPAIEVAPLFDFTNSSGYLSAPYDGTLSVDFTPEELALFCQQWETETGKSTDPRFQCWCYPYQQFLETRPVPSEDSGEVEIKWDHDK